MNTQTGLNQYLADVNVLFRKVQNFHWNVVGPDFVPVHTLLQTLYEELDGQIDIVAERILSIGGQPLGTMKSYLETTKITEAENKKIATKEALQLVKADYAYMLESLKAVKVVADEENDYGTSAMLDEYITSYEKTLWIFSSIMATA
ncbi:MAG: Dps family protein [Culicoidibacterales bacterium]